MAQEVTISALEASGPIFFKNITITVYFIQQCWWTTTELRLCFVENAKSIKSTHPVQCMYCTLHTMHSVRILICVADSQYFKSENLQIISRFGSATLGALSTKTSGSSTHTPTPTPRTIGHQRKQCSQLKNRYAATNDLRLRLFIRISIWLLLWI
jgi:hypothetical protein